MTQENTSVLSPLNLLIARCNKMPFTLEEKWEVLRILQVDISEETPVMELLERLETRSEAWVQQTQKLILRIKDFENKADEAATGLTRVDVIEWKENRKCDITHHLDKLRRELAKTIDYKLHSQFNPFSLGEEQNANWKFYEPCCPKVSRPYFWR
jgi:CRISPR/Cas system-associated protein Csx1